MQTIAVKKLDIFSSRENIQATTKSVTVVRWGMRIAPFEKPKAGPATLTGRLCQCLTQILDFGYKTNVTLVSTAKEKFSKLPKQKHQMKLSRTILGILIHQNHLRSSGRVTVVWDSYLKNATVQSKGPCTFENIYLFLS